MQKTIPIAICGAGPVGQALALLLHQRGIAAQDILLLDAKTSEQACQDARSIALSFGSQQILSSINATLSKATSIQEIHVSRRAHFGRCLIEASDYSLPALGYVARYGDIVTPLEVSIAKANIHIQRPVQVMRIQSHEDYVELQLNKNANGNDNDSIHCQILIQAEGGTFDDQAKGMQHHDYQQTAIISHVTCSKFQAHRAFERFTEEGPLALLPQGDGYSLVWCVRPETAQQLCALDDKAFLNALQTAFGGRVGNFLSASQRFTYQLGLNVQDNRNKQNDQITLHHRRVKIGNAAQTLHPVAGQGLNLGLRDAYNLAQCLTQSLTQSLDQNLINSELQNKDSIQNALTLFMRQRQTDRNNSIRITDTMARIFASSADGTMKQAALGLGLGVVDMFKPAKKLLAEQMMFGSR
jgi:2-octaprenyl-6-methoxyphenol hydroxylase